MSAEKDSCLVTLKRTDYINKLKVMRLLNGSAKSATYIKCQDTTLSDLKLFQDFLQWNLKNEKYDKMRPVTSQPEKLYATTKTHKLNNIEGTNLEKLKFRPVMDQTGIFTCNFSKVIADYRKPLCQNEDSIKDTQCFPEMLRDLPPLNNNEEYISYDVDSFFTSFPLKRLLITF